MSSHSRPTNACGHIFEANLAHRTQLALDNQNTCQHSKKTRKRQNEMHLQRNNSEDQRGKHSKRSPPNRLYRMSLAPRGRNGCSETFIRLQLLFDIAKDSLLIVRKWHAHSLARIARKLNVTRIIRKRLAAPMGCW